MTIALTSPAVCELEFTNVLRAACVRQRLGAQRAQAIVAQIGALPIDVGRHPVARSEMLALALRFGLSSYDAAYLELALPLLPHRHPGRGHAPGRVGRGGGLAGGRLKTALVVARPEPDAARRVGAVG